jgi:stage V sporulation protein G
VKITNIQVYPIQEPKGKLRAHARILLDDELQLNGLRIYEGHAGFFVSFPSDPDKGDEDYRQVFYPVTHELRDHIEGTVLDEYLKAVAPGLFSENLEEVIRHSFHDYGKLNEIVKKIVQRRLQEGDKP